LGVAALERFYVPGIVCYRRVGLESPSKYPEGYRSEGVIFGIVTDDP